MKARIEVEGCIECRGPSSVCPEIFELKEGKKASIVKEYRTGEPGDGEVEDDLVSCVEEACPVDIIIME
jgi:ferredoxin